MLWSCYSYGQVSHTLKFSTIINKEKLFQEPEELVEMIAKVLKTGLEGLVLKNVNVSFSEKSKSSLIFFF